MKICGIYLIKSPSGKIYIGQSVDINRRLSHYKRKGAKEQPYLNSSFIKYGFDSHSIKILTECDRMELNEKEQFYIKKYNSFRSKIGMNLTSGGNQNWTISEETRLRMKNRPKIKHSEETRKKMSESALGKNTGKTSPRKGVKLSEETRNKIKKNHRHTKSFLGKKHTEESKQKMREKSLGRSNDKVKIPIINTKTLKVFKSKIEAANSIGMKVRTLKAKLLGKLKNNTDFVYLRDFT